METIMTIITIILELSFLIVIFFGLEVTATKKNKKH